MTLPTESPGVRAGADALATMVAELATLDDAGLRRRWRTLVGRPLLAGLGRALILRILAYQLQARHYGDLDRASAQAFAALVGSPAGRYEQDDPPADGVNGSARKRQTKPSRLLRPGTILTREHGGVTHRVMVLDRGFAWHGKTYASLSTLALAITGTRWNGHRFFGLQDRGTPRKDRGPIAPPLSTTPSASHGVGLETDCHGAFGGMAP